MKSHHNYNALELYIRVLLALGLITINLTACKKFVDVPAPITSISSQNVYTTDPSIGEYMEVFD